MSPATINCLCGAINVPYPGELPAETELCHCNPCRHTSGALYEGFAPLRSSPEASVLEKCTAYHSSKTHTRYFCTECGTKLFINSRYRADGTKRGDHESWSVIGGAIEPASDSTDDVLAVDSHMWLADTGDGGLAPLMRKLGGQNLPCYNTQSDEFSNEDLEGMVSKSTTFSTKRNEGDSVKAECRCGGVSLSIKRANHADGSLPKLDRYIPRDRDGNVQNDKYYASTCVCRSCRLHFGVSLTAWLYIPPPQIINPHSGKAVILHRGVESAEAKDANAGLKLKHYWSREDCCRSFCSDCGAAVFYTRDHRPEITNIAAGLMRAEEGVLARSWVSWNWGSVSFPEEARDKKILEAWKATTES